MIFYDTVLVHNAQETIIIGGRSLRLMYLFQLPAFVVVTKEWKSGVVIRINKLSSWVRRILDERERINRLTKYRFVPEETASGLLWRIPEWWISDIRRGRYNKFQRRSVIRCRLKFSLLTNLYARTRLRKRNKRRRLRFSFYKHKLLKSAIISNVAILNIYSFFKKIFFHRSSASGFRVASDASYRLSRMPIEGGTFVSFPQLGYLVVKLLYKTVKHSFFISEASISVIVFFSKWFTSVSRSPLSMLPYIGLFTNKMRRCIWTLYRVLSLSDSTLAVSYYIDSIVRLVSFWYLVLDRSRFLVHASLASFMRKLFFSDIISTRSIVGSGANFVFSSGWKFFLRRSSILARQVTGKPAVQSGSGSTLIVRSTAYNTYITFLLGRRILYKQSAGMFEENRKARKTYKVAQSMADRFILHFRKFVLRYRIRSIDFMFSGFRIMEKVFKRIISRFRIEYLRMRKNALWSLVRLTRRFRRLCYIRSKNRSSLVKQFVRSKRELLLQIRHASLFRFSRRYIFIVHNKPFNGCRGRLFITYRK